jgi:hypothetical protein
MSKLQVPFGAFVLTLTFAIVSVSSGHIYLFDAPSLFGNNVDWAFSDIQRCYSVPCFSDRTHSLKFRDLPGGGHLVVYDDAECQGKHYKVAPTPDGKITYRDWGFEFGVSSFMIWSTGMYATNGMTNICEDHDKERINANATRNVTEG